ALKMSTPSDPLRAPADVTERIPAPVTERIQSDRNQSERVHVGETAGRAVDPRRAAGARARTSAANRSDLPGERSEGASAAYRIEGGDPKAPVPVVTVVLPCFNE